MIHDVPWYIIISSWCFTKWKLRWMATFFSCSSYTKKTVWLCSSHASSKKCLKSSRWCVQNEYFLDYISHFQYQLQGNLSSVHWLEGQCIALGDCTCVLWRWRESDLIWILFWVPLMMFSVKWLHIIVSTKDLVFGSFNFTLLNSFVYVGFLRWARVWASGTWGACCGLCAASDDGSFGD